MQIERGDESLVANFGIDIRILGVLHWNSDDNKITMEQLWNDLEEKTGHYLGQWYSGDTWSDYVDAIIGITAQPTPGDSTVGLAPPPKYIDQGRILILLKWQVYWMDDNIVQHEISHLFYACDHFEPCCVMSYHTHYYLIIWEDTFWWVNDYVLCLYTAYDWCTSCKNLIMKYSNLYINANHMLVVRTEPHDHPYQSYCAISPSRGVYIYTNPTSVTVSVPHTWGGYNFYYWCINDVYYSSDSSITICVNGKRTATAYLYYNGEPDNGGGDYPITREKLKTFDDAYGND